MDIQMIFGGQGKGKEYTEDFIHESLEDTIKFLSEDEKSESELLADFTYEDFVRCR